MPKTKQDVERETETANREDRSINLKGWNLAGVDLRRLNLFGQTAVGLT